MATVVNEFALISQTRLVALDSTTIANQGEALELFLAFYKVNV